MPGGAITVADVPMGVCFAHQTPTPWVGSIIPMQAQVLIKGIPMAINSNMVMMSCGHIGAVVGSSTSTVLPTGPACCGLSSVICPGFGIVFPTIGNAVMIR